MLWKKNTDDAEESDDEKEVNEKNTYNHVKYPYCLEPWEIGALSIEAQRLVVIKSNNSRESYHKT